MGRIHYFTGPVRSGKSRHALALANSWGGSLVYVATYISNPADAEMEDRVRRHQAERGAAWRTLDAPVDLVAALRALDPPPSGIMLDCMTMWLGSQMESSDEAILEAWEQILDYLKDTPWPSVIVGNEVGWSLVPAEPMSRRFRDLAGWLSQATARKADEACLCVAGCPVRLK